MRASVFTAINEKSVSGTYNENKSLKKLQESSDGESISESHLLTKTARVVLDLIREFLEFYGLNFTLSVLIPEADLVSFFFIICQFRLIPFKPKAYGGRSALAKNLSLSGNGALLSDLLQQAKKGGISTGSNPGPAAAATTSLANKPDPAAQKEAERLKREQEEREKKEKEDKQKKSSLSDAPPIMGRNLPAFSKSAPVKPPEPTKVRFRMINSLFFKFLCIGEL